MKQRKSKSKNKKIQRRRRKSKSVLESSSNKKVDVALVEYPITDIDFHFGTVRYLPKKEDCKADKRYSEIAAYLFFRGCDGCPPDLKPKEGINWRTAMYVVFAHLKSFDPSHEHKMLGCGELLSKFFDLKD